MRHPLVPLLLLVVVPLLALLHRLGVLSRRAARAVLAAACVAVLAAAVWAGGVDFTYLNRIKMGIAAAVVSLVLLHHWKVAGLQRERTYRIALALLVVPAWLVHLNFLAFHGTGQTRVYLHLHDVAHYYLGSKYFSELGYSGLYTAMLRAEAELYADHFKAIEARDLENNALVHIRVLLMRSGPVKERFSPERWEEFQRDVAYFRDALDAQYGDVLRDHGFNPTPVWALVGGTLANLVPGGSHRGILALALLDPVLQAAMFAAVAWAFGSEALLLSLIYFCIPFGASFGWTGGSHLRHLWLFGLVVGLSCLRRGRHAAAGALLSLASCLRVFPVMFLTGLSAKAVNELAVARRPSSGSVRLFALFSATGILLAGLSLTLPRGRQHWSEFRSNMRRHLEVEATNLVGLGEIVAYDGGTFPTNEEEAARSAARRTLLYRIQLAIVLPLLIAFVVARARRDDEVSLLLLGSLVVFCTLSLASYYYVFLIVYAAARARRHLQIALLFGTEVAIYALALFEDREAVLFFYRSALVAYLLIALHFDAIASEIGQLTRWMRRRALA